MTERAEFEQVPAGLTWLRNLRYADTSDWSRDDAGRAFRWLTALRYSADQGVRKFAAVLAALPPIEDEGDEVEATMEATSG